MPDAKRINEAIGVIDELMSQLVELTNGVHQSGDTDIGSEHLKRWKERAVRKLSETISSSEGKKLAAKQKKTFRVGYPVGNLMDEAKLYEGFLIALRREVAEHPEDILDRPAPTSQETSDSVAAPAPKGKAVFIVHGHDELNVLRLKELLRDRYSLESIVLAGQVGRGRSIIEKFEDEAQRAAFAFVLLTPDDVIRKNEDEYSQARPNVIFELGWFYGRLGRERVCILFKKGTKIHSDLEGVSRVEFEDSVVDKVPEIERELIAGQMLQKK